MTIFRDNVDSAVKQMLATETGKDVGFGEPPADEPDMEAGYYILNHSPSPRPYGSWDNKEDMPYLDYLVRSVGRSWRHVDRLSSMAREAVLHVEFTITGAGIVSRDTITFGVAQRSGRDLWELPDIYRLTLQET